VGLGPFLVCLLFSFLFEFFFFSVLAVCLRGRGKQRPESSRRGEAPPVPSSPVSSYGESQRRRRQEASPAAVCAAQALFPLFFCCPVDFLSPMRRALFSPLGCQRRRRGGGWGGGWAGLRLVLALSSSRSLRLEFEAEDWS
jgi:hypothetical protein